MTEKRKLETTEEANNQERKIAEKKAEKQKLETTEQANNRKRTTNNPIFAKMDSADVQLQ
jgi:hypothetical protein